MQLSLGQHSQHAWHHLDKQQHDKICFINIQTLLCLFTTVFVFSCNLLWVAMLAQTMLFLLIFVYFYFFISDIGPQPFFALIQIRLRVDVTHFLELEL